jgi:hypothetical protein
MEQNKKHDFQLLVLIATPKLADKAAEMFLKSALPLQYRLHAQGTASSQIMDTLGLGSSAKTVLLSTVPESFGKHMLAMLHEELRLDAVNSGIAFTIPLTAASNLLFNMMTQTAEKSKDSDLGKRGFYMSEAKHVLITAIVNRGFGGEVMDAARAAGARVADANRRFGAESEFAQYHSNLLNSLLPDDFANTRAVNEASADFESLWKEFGL